ncbi:hypothetical protein EP7_002136 [Isosphaeraceae bacterium EP7]
MTPDDLQDRRQFVRTLALVAPASLLAAPAPADEPKDVVKTDKPVETEVDARMALIIQRYGKRLDAAALKSVRSDVEDQVRRVERLRKFPLDNGDGPMPVFTPYRAPLA